MRAVDIIRKKRDGLALTPAEIDDFVLGAARGDWPDYQTSALLMAIVLRGMDAVETAALTSAMVRSGVRCDWSDLPGVAVDKHSTGGVGDKTSLVLAPLAAACGVLVPMMSGRGLGHTAGTLDKLESIAGFRVRLTLDELRAALTKVGCALIGQTAEVAPADRVLYALRDVTATVESIPLITGSILSKKIAEGIRGLVMDVKCGVGAFMKTREDARELAESLVRVGEANGVRTQALITAMDAPLGRCAGHALEVAECIEVLKGGEPEDVRELSVQLAARMVHLGQAAASLAEAESKVRAALSSGRGLEKFRQIIEQQGGDVRVIDDPGQLPAAPHREVIRAERAGYVQEWHALKLGEAIAVLGGGRERVTDAIDHAVGAVLLAKPGDRVAAGDGLLELHYRDASKLAAAKERLAGVYTIGDAPPLAQPLVLEVLE
jgi:pyrimidine-nucleoside phosphorylase